MSLATGDLTTLATAQQYLDSPPSAAVLAGIVTRSSRAISACLNRGLLVPKTYTEQFSGNGNCELVLPNYPLITLDSLRIGGQEMFIAPQANQSDTAVNPYGFRFQPWNGIPPGTAAVIGLTGGAFYLWGQQNVVVSYRAGYQVTDEAQTIPAVTPFQVLPLCPYGIWATDEGVKFTASGASLTAISSGTPAASQYLPPDPNATVPRLYYTFAASDAGKGVLISYGFVPADLEQAVLETMQDRVSYRRRAGGVRSQSLAGQETIVYGGSDGLSDFVKGILGPYYSPLPPAMGVIV
jgi:hypothetical protein